MFDTIIIINIYIYIHIFNTISKHKMGLVHYLVHHILWSPKFGFTKYIAHFAENDQHWFTMNFWSTPLSEKPMMRRPDQQCCEAVKCGSCWCLLPWYSMNLNDILVYFSGVIYKGFTWVHVCSEKHSMLNICSICNLFSRGLKVLHGELLFVVRAGLPYDYGGVKVG